ncbi:MAG: DMT family protein [Phycisphaerales bacterium]
MPTWILPVLLLIGSNVFMTFAWYYHLKKDWSILVAILASWGIALFEYCLQVPANRLGHIKHGGIFTAPQLKIIQEGITLTVFAVFSVFVLQEKLRWTDWTAFGLIFAGVAVGMLGKTS